MQGYFKNIASNLLTESINAANAGEAIRHRNEVEITYSGDDGGKRIIQPVAYGLSKAGNMVLRAFQPFGTTKTKVPHWKMFRLDKIDSWKILRNRIFSEPPGQYSAEGKFNANGDESMSEVYLVANFERSKDYHSGKRYGGLKQYNTQRSEKKKEDDPFYQFKKNIANSYVSKDVSDRVKNNPSDAARSYVNGNDEYQKDIFRVQKGDDETEVVSNEPITKDYKPQIKQNDTTQNIDNEDTFEIEIDDNNEEENDINNG